MNKQILKLAIPSILANITVPLVGIVDLAIAGHLGSAASIGGIAIGTMLFDLLYWNMGFLRVGTGGITAQAYGRKDYKAAMNAATQGIATALTVALFIWIIQWGYVEVSFSLIKCTPEVENLARQYFFIRVWAAPATLCLMVFKGWFIGMQNTVFPMSVDLTVNILNLVLSYILAIHTPMGIKGIAFGTIISQYLGLILAILLIRLNFKKFFQYINIKASIKLKDMRQFFAMNGNLFVRSACMLVIYTGFTSIAANYGNTLLAVSSVMMKLLLLYSYLVDGFAYAGEALTGRFIGENDSYSLHLVIKKLFIWCIGIGVLSTVIYAFAGEPLIRLLTDNVEVIKASKPFLFWLLLMPVVSCAAFTWDGIYIGATASRALRNGMILSSAFFILSYLALKGIMGIQALYLAYFVHLIIRTIYMSVMAKKEIYGLLD
ncbi:MAG: MATE family efflux transporter [Bacteroidales bacterium]|jgi:MATE family multidrug resistance protein|nr:MATE family efflux transporter [Bacteroidales bacterium]